MNRLIIVGASGHGRVVADIALLNGYTDIAFVDDNEKVKECAGFPVVAKSMNAPDGDLIVAIGDAADRKRFAEYYQDRSMPTLIHPDAVIAKDVKIGGGTVIMAGVVINSGAKVGSNCILNTCSSVDHDCIVSDYAHIAVGAHLCGTVTIGQETLIGAGATVCNNVNICGCCMIGAGAVVIKDIDRPGTYVGVPAKEINRNPF